MAVKAKFQSFRNHFLIATPMLLDPNFFHSVTYICEHTEEGAMGIVINHPLDLYLGDILEHMEITATKETIANRPVFAGGPVQRERGFVIHRPDAMPWQSTMNITDDIAVTTSRDILQAIAQGSGPEHSIVALGYAGWEHGQLEKEIAENSWLCHKATPEILFNVPFNHQWQASAKLLGIKNISQLTYLTGHA